MRGFFIWISSFVSSFRLHALGALLRIILIRMKETDIIGTMQSFLEQNEW